MQTCTGHIRRTTGQLLGLCISCAHLDSQATTKLAKPVLGPQVPAWTCPGWAPLASPATAQHAAAPRPTA